MKLYYKPRALQTSFSLENEANGTFPSNFNDLSDANCSVVVVSHKQDQNGFVLHKVLKFVDSSTTGKAKISRELPFSGEKFGGVTIYFLLEDSSKPVYFQLTDTSSYSPHTRIRVNPSTGGNRLEAYCYNNQTQDVVWEPVLDENGNEIYISSNKWYCLSIACDASSYTGYFYRIWITNTDSPDGELHICKHATYAGQGDYEFWYNTNNFTFNSLEIETDSTTTSTVYCGGINPYSFEGSSCLKVTNFPPHWKLLEARELRISRELDNVGILEAILKHRRDEDLYWEDLNYTDILVLKDSGYYVYNAEHSWEELDSGDPITEDGWSVDITSGYTGTAYYHLLENYLGQPKAIRLSMTYDDNGQFDELVVTRTFNGQGYGTIEFWCLIEDVTVLTVYLRSGSTEAIRIQFEAGEGVTRGKLWLYDGVNNTFVTYYNKCQWYHVRVDFECTTGNYQGLSQYQFKLTITARKEVAEYGPYSFKNSVSSIDSLQFETGECYDPESKVYSVYLAAVDFSWADNYFAGRSLGFKVVGTLFRGRITKVEIDNKTLKISGTDYLGEFADVDIESSTDYALYVATITNVDSSTTVTCGDENWNTDQWANQYLVVIPQGPEGMQLKFPSSVEFQKRDGSTATPNIVDGGVDSIKQIAGVWRGRSWGSYTDCDFCSVITFTNVSTSLAKVVLKIILRIGLWNHYAPVNKPVLEIYNVNTSSWETLQELDYNVSGLKSIELTNYTNYVDASGNLKIRIAGGISQATKYSIDWQTTYDWRRYRTDKQVYFARLDLYSADLERIPHIYTISSNTSNQITIDGTYSFTQDHVAEGDQVRILSRTDQVVNDMLAYSTRLIKGEISTGIAYFGGSVQGMTPLALIQECAKIDKYRFWHDLDLNFYYKDVTNGSSLGTLTDSDLIQIRAIRNPSEYYNVVQVIGANGAISEAKYDSDSIARFGIVRKKVIIDTNIYTVAECNEKAEQLLEKYKTIETTLRVTTLTDLYTQFNTSDLLGKKVTIQTETINSDYVIEGITHFQDIGKDTTLKTEIRLGNLPTNYDPVRYFASKIVKLEEQIRKINARGQTEWIEIVPDWMQPRDGYTYGTDYVAWDTTNVRILFGPNSYDAGHWLCGIFTLPPNTVPGSPIYFLPFFHRTTSDTYSDTIKIRVEYYAFRPGKRGSVDHGLYDNSSLAISLCSNWRVLPIGFNTGKIEPGLRILWYMKLQDADEVYAYSLRSMRLRILVWK